MTPVFRLEPFNASLIVYEQSPLYGLCGRMCPVAVICFEDLRFSIAEKQKQKQTAAAAAAAAATTTSRENNELYRLGKTG